MSQTTAIWVLIVLALVFANLPFVLQRPLLFLPWPQKAERARPALQRWLLFIIFSALIVGLAVGAYAWLSQQFFSGALSLLLTTVSLLLIGEIGRASCRERGETAGGSVSE